MPVEYARNGLVGVFTPQANTTVEPELALLMPRGYAWINARLMSGKVTIEDRLRDYFASYEASLAQFANAPVNAIAYACTGASYFAGPAVEDTLIARLEDRAGVPVVTAASAVVDALRALGAERIGLVSPYGGGIDAASTAYWQARGFHVVRKTSAYRETADFHPIYSLPAEAAQQALDEMAGETVDAVVMLGTGMPTLAPIMARPRVGSAPVLSCMVALAWRATLGARWDEPDRDSLMTMLDEGIWRERLATASRPGNQPFTPRGGGPRSPAGSRR